MSESDQIPPSESYNVHNQSCETNETKADIIPLVLNLIPSKSLDRYRPLKFLAILHDLPPQHYKYLPKFDGELDKLSAKKHIEAFEYFTDLFEVEHDDVYMRAFSQSLQEDAKEWFRNLLPESISSWEERRDVFLKFGVK